MKKIFMDKGKSFKFLGMRYTKKPYMKLEIGDEVIIHPIKAGLLEKVFFTSGFKSQATKSYPAKIIVKEIPWVTQSHKYSDYNIKEPKNELCLEGINENKNWHGVVLNQYGFGRLEFVKRNSDIA